MSELLMMKKCKATIDYLRLARVGLEQASELTDDDELKEVYTSAITNVTNEIININYILSKCKLQNKAFYG